MLEIKPIILFLSLIMCFYLLQLQFNSSIFFPLQNQCKKKLVGLEEMANLWLIHTIAWLDKEIPKEIGTNFEL